MERKVTIKGVKIAEAKIEVNIEGERFNIECPETFVREGFNFLKNELMPYLMGEVKEKSTEKARAAITRVIFFKMASKHLIDKQDTVFNPIGHNNLVSTPEISL